MCTLPRPAAAPLLGALSRPRVVINCIASICSMLGPPRGAMGPIGGPGSGFSHQLCQTCLLWSTAIRYCHSVLPSSTGKGRHAPGNHTHAREARDVHEARIGTSISGPSCPVLGSSTGHLKACGVHFPFPLQFGWYWAGSRGPCAPAAAMSPGLHCCCGTVVRAACRPVKRMPRWNE
jgi:hypothetical protein